MQLRNAPYRCTEAAYRDRVDTALESGCRCGADSAALVRRRKAHGGIIVTVQCDTCGTSLTGDLARAAFPFWQDLPEWDEAKKEAYWQTQRTQAVATVAGIRAEIDTRRDEYNLWLATNPEWHTLRQLVHLRARRTCEACLAAPSEHIHHDGYSAGKLPPAWLLRAVCAKCHDRLHRRDPGDDWTRRSC